MEVVTTILADVKSLTWKRERKEPPICEEEEFQAAETASIMSWK